MTPTDSGAIDWPVFIGVTLILVGFAAYATGRALAATWRPAYWAAIYAALLGAGDRFIQYALFDGDLLSPLGYAMDTATLVIIALASYRITQVTRMVRQYPWLYRRAGLFSWRSIARDGAMAGSGEEILQNRPNLEKN
jgi:hypothetical protein